MMTPAKKLEKHVLRKLAKTESAIRQSRDNLGRETDRYVALKRIQTDLVTMLKKLQAL